MALAVDDPSWKGSETARRAIDGDTHIIPRQGGLAELGLTPREEALGRWSYNC